ncbi:N4-gp56 family major capsid protein [Nocardioides massiliensis]|uniref:N4-gp56 family major capsid protein n=1 Tax=Nocardioides massiliensis TaxID=1325935 RepID=A0ABT9NJF9_9ACTN|nr:N4-gp56 family major capsid protein [Nocardioides massiliensis]MDP9820486.1 N4-gp56 family major capsid protein [Nocardioides massiliensis]
MADAFISTSTLPASVKTALDMYVRAELRHQPILRTLADTRPVQVDRPGSSIALYTASDLAPSTTPLSETADPDFVALPDPTAVTLTPYEYGNATISTVKVGATSFHDIDPYQRDRVVHNMRDSLDVLVRDVVSAGTNVRYAGTATSTATVDNDDVITSDDVRTIVTKLRSAGAPARLADLYWCGIHPDVAHDLRREVGNTGWMEAHKYAAPGVFWPGVTGVYQGVYFQESARMKVAADGVDLDGAGAGTAQAKVYRTVFAGKEALAEGVVVEPEVRVGVVPDRLNRFQPLGWYGFLGWARFREACLWRLESGSSINA